MVETNKSVLGEDFVDGVLFKGGLGSLLEVNSQLVDSTTVERLRADCDVTKQRREHQEQEEGIRRRT